MIIEKLTTGIGYLTDWLRTFVNGITGGTIFTDIILLVISVIVAIIIASKLHQAKAWKWIILLTILILLILGGI